MWSNRFPFVSQDQNVISLCGDVCTALKNSTGSIGYLQSSQPALNTTLTQLCPGHCIFPSRVWGVEALPCSYSAWRVNMVWKVALGHPPKCNVDNSLHVSWQMGVVVFLFYTEGL